MSVVLKFTEQELTDVVNFKMPPTVYELGVNLTTPEITFEKKVGMWGLRWVGTSGTIDKGCLAVIPTDPISKRIARAAHTRFYMAHGFTEREASLLGTLKIPFYHEVETVKFLLDLHRHVGRDDIIRRVTVMNDISPLVSLLPDPLYMGKKRLLKTFYKYMAFLELHS